MFPDLLFLVFAYSVCFGIQHKLPFLHGKFNLLDEMLECTYCTGFHAGWLSWAFVFGVVGQFPADGFLANAGSMISWAFVSAISCYSFDALIKWVEVHSVVPEFEEAG